MTQLGCDTPGAVPTRAVYIGESPSPIDAQAVMERPLSASLSSTSFSKTLVATAISGSAHLARTNSPICSPAACVTNVGIRNPIWTQMHVQGLLCVLLMGGSRQARGVTAYLYDYSAHATLQRRLFLLWSETSRCMGTALTPAEAAVIRLRCGCLPCIN
jgi:hypothetical protein